MDTEGGQGSVLVCTPSSSLINSCFGVPSAASSSALITDVETKNKNKQKKKRSKTKQKNANKDEEADCSKLSGDIENQVAETFSDLSVCLQSTSVQETQKPKKKVRKRKKSSVERENAESSSPSQHFGRSVSMEYDVTDNFSTPPNARFQSSHKIHSIGSPKQTEPFFSDNRKSSSSKKKSNSKKKSENEAFEDYISLDEVEVGLKEKRMIAGNIRINARCYKEAYISSEGDEKDIMIEGLKDRNRALEGDEVVVLIYPPDAWKVNSGQRTGKVVYIKEHFHSRTCVGKLQSTIEPNSTYVVFSPRDPRVPRIRIPLSDPSLPAEYKHNPALYSEKLFTAEITNWTNVNFAHGKVLVEIGDSGEVEVETLAILLENNLDPRPIDPKLNIFFPRLPYSIPSEEISKRLDLRKECIFTIDPATAKDLDDAVSAKKLDNGNTEVGVHISDVSHFLKYNTMLDHYVSKRATTIYLVQRVYHMLPVELCQLCSLMPGEDKLAFSVFVELTPDAQVVSHRFARTVIHSCTKLAYEHAQMVIDNPDKKFTEEDFPEVGNGFSAEDCAERIRELYKLSVIMRKRRFDTGALRIDQPKLCFHLDEERQAPLSSFIYQNKESHRLIEEFMLLANITVAEHIYSVYPEIAFLRQHSPPKANMMLDLQKRLEMYGINLDITDAGTLHTSILKYSSPLENEEESLSWARYIVLNQLCAKPMLRAAYFCPSDDMPDLHHYALNADCYTHFTSPIRRYADVVVHRLLAASLGLAPKPSWDKLYTGRIANICNRQKNAAKVAGEQSSLLFLALYLKEPVESLAAVIDVKDRSADVMVKEFGVVLRVYTDPLKAKVEFVNDDNMAQLYIQWQEGGPVQLIQLFSLVRVLVSRAKDGLKLTATLLPPHPS